MNTKNFLIVLSILFCFQCVGCFDAKKEIEPTAIITKTLNGVVEIKRVGTSEYTKVEGKTPLFDGDTVKTDDKAVAEIQYSNGANGDIFPNTEFQIKGRKTEKQSLSVVYNRLVDGIVTFYVPKGSQNSEKFEVSTNRAVASIKGTIFKLSHENDVTTLTVKEGVVLFSRIKDEKIEPNLDPDKPADSPESKPGDNQKLNDVKPTQGAAKTGIDPINDGINPFAEHDKNSVEIGPFQQASIGPDGISGPIKCNIMLDKDFRGYIDPEKGTH